MEQVSYALDQGWAVVLEGEVLEEEVLLGKVVEEEVPEVPPETEWRFWSVVFQPYWFVSWSELPLLSEGLE